MKYLRAFTAIGHGLKLCFTQSSVRALALWPWAIGCVAYFATLYGAYIAHSTVLHWMVNDPSSWWMKIVYAGAWLLAAALLLVCSMLISMCLVLIFAGIFQSAIASAVLSHSGFPPPESGSGVGELVGETGRTIAVELKKLVWLLPLMFMTLVLGFIPFIAPFALVLGAWLLAYQFVDTVLDLFKIRVRDRVRFASSNAPALIVFGAALSLCWAVPFLGILLAPAASAGAAWLLADPAFAEQITKVRLEQK